MAKVVFHVKVSQEGAQGQEEWAVIIKLIIKKQHCLSPRLSR